VGTDIHISPEFYNNGRWQRLQITLDVHRNYNVFAVLANVRNGTGFAGIVTGGGYEAIAERRGLPANASPETRDYFGLKPGDSNADIDHSGYFHSATWLRLDEILNYNWNKVTWHRGVLAESQWEEYQTYGEPVNGYSGDVSGGKVVILTTEQMRDLKESRMRRDDSKSYFFEVKWSTTYWEDCKHFVEHLRDRLLPVGKPEHIRLVIAFDS